MIFIAEIGLNHNGNLDLCFEMIKQAKQAGADIVKFQLGWRDKPGEINCIDKDWLKKLKAWCDYFNIEFMSSIITFDAFGMIKEVKPNRYKIASRTLKDNFELAKAIVAEGKETIVSLGMWDGADFPKIDGKAISFLYCISKYPTPLEDVNLRYVDFNKYTGFSDHTIGITAPCVAMSRGAKIIEKHFTLDKQMHGPDHECSMTPTELKQICQFRDELERCL